MRKRKKQSPWETLIKSPAAIGAAAAVLLALIIWGAVSARRAAITAPASGSVKVDINKMREQLRTGGFGRR
ncbi:MAG: hypothetical protein NT029_13055 [Armatimonadetes bacterium]|nr:hypothetical protein [Armatimonadota bacterium]